MTKEIGLGLIGFGTVGGGVVAALQNNADLMAKRTGVRLVLRKIADLDLDRDRGVKVDRSLLTKDAMGVIADPAVDIVIELIGGMNMARTIISKTLCLGKPVVTANKALLAEHGEELFRLAAEHETNLFFEASVGGGIPLIRSLREGLVSNRMRSLCGILNGTCNYILTRMEQEHLPFEQVLSEAQSAGYAEADSSLDIDGIDTAHKAVILASLAYGFHVPMSSVAVEGIRGLDRMEIEYAADLGYRIKMLAIIKNIDAGIEIRVNPTLVPVHHIIASVSGVFNAVMMNGDGVGDVLCYGRGAGRDPTASAVLSDIVDAARDIVSNSRRRAPGFVPFRQDGRIRDISEARVRCYLRLSLLDKPGVFGQIGTVLGRHGISIASLLQKEILTGNHAPVVIITHYASEGAFRAALEEINSMSVVGAPTVRLRIEDFE